MTPLRTAIIEGAYWLRRPDPSSQVAIAYCGAVAPEAMAAVVRLMERQPHLGVLAVTSPDRLHAGWIAAQNARAGIGAPADRTAPQPRRDPARRTARWRRHRHRD